MKPLPESSYENLEANLVRAARHFPYPPTPNLAREVQAKIRDRSTARLHLSLPRQRLIWLTAIILLLSLTLLTVPPLRAAVLEVIRLGAVRIFLTEPPPTRLIPPTASTTATTPEALTSPASPAPLLPTSLLNLAGETTLAAAQVGFPLRLPTQPADLGPPDKVYLQDLNGPVIVLVWLDPNQPNRVRLSLHYLNPNTLAGKGPLQTLQRTTVHNQPALWVTGPHLLQFEGQQYDLVRLVEGRVLIWTEGEITYRLETDLSLEEAIQIAESLR